MTRKRYEKLMRALSHKMGEKHGYSVTGDMLKKQREVAAYNARTTHGSYKAAWDYYKNIRDAYGMV